MMSYHGSFANHAELLLAGCLGKNIIHYLFAFTLIIRLAEQLWLKSRYHYKLLQYQRQIKRQNRIFSLNNFSIDIPNKSKLMVVDDYEISVKMVHLWNRRL